MKIWKGRAYHGAVWRGGDWKWWGYYELREPGRVVDVEVGPFADVLPPVVCDGRRVVDGNNRLEAARRLGLRRVAAETREEATVKIWKFSSTSRAYDACQTDDRIRDGDVLVVESERVAGVASTWPTAVTQESGVLHELAFGARLAGAQARGWRDAARVARSKGWPVRGVDAAVTPAVVEEQEEHARREAVLEQRLRMAEAADDDHRFDDPEYVRKQLATVRQMRANAAARIARHKRARR